MKKTVVLTGPELLTKSTVRWLKQIFQLKVVDHQISEHELANLLYYSSAAGLIHGSATFVSDYLFKHSPQMKWSIFPGMEPFPTYNRPALDYCRDHKIPVYPTGGGIRAVAETTCKQISEPTLLKKRAAGRRIEVPFHYRNYHYYESLSVIGLGHMAQKILTGCPVISRFDSVCYSGRSEKPEFTEKSGIPFRSMEEAFRADVVILTVAHIPEVTDGYINLDLLRHIDECGLLINNIRPQIMNMVDTLKFARERPDVTIVIDASEAEIGREYGRETLSAIRKIPNIILTGHTAWKKLYTLKEYSVGVRKVIAENNLA